MKDKRDKRIRKIIHRQTFKDGLGKTFGIAVPIEVTYFRIDGKWVETVSASEWRKIEAAIEAVYPGWFHKISSGGKHYKNCPACDRVKKIKELGKK